MTGAVNGDNWSYKTCKAPVKSSPQTNQHPAFYRPEALLSPNQQCQSTEGKSLVPTLIWKFCPVMCNVFTGRWSTRTELFSEKIVAYVTNLPRSQVVRFNSVLMMFLYLLLNRTESTHTHTHKSLSVPFLSS